MSTASCWTGGRVRRPVRPHRRRPDPARRHQPADRGRGGPQRRPDPGDEVVFGGGKVIRESMGQSRATRAEGSPDTVITGAVVLDHWGIVKADVGIRDGRIVALGKAGNPDTMDGVHPDLVIGPGTEIIAGNGKILTAGAIDSHVHLICPTDPGHRPGQRHHHDHRRRHRPGRGHQGHHRHPERLAPGPDARGARPRGRSTCCCSARATRCREESMWEQLRGGAGGFKLHEDWGTTPGRDRRLPAGRRRLRACRSPSTPTP